MTIMHPVQQTERAKAVLFTVASTHSAEIDALLDELSALVEAAGAEVLGRMIQCKAHPDPALFLGSGKVRELKALCASLGCGIAICDDELSPSQQRNLEKELELKVLDRTQVILDIFAARASSAEGKMQVELAQLAYILPRLRGKGVEMSGLGASARGIRTRGPGETKLEYDRRRIKSRMADLKGQVDELDQHRSLARSQRAARGVPTVAFVGYTNAGKSSLLNALTEGGALVENKLFATLDPTARELTLPDGRTVMLVDTVGFVRKLPHQLIKAFRATLAEVRQADLLLHVVDISHPDALLQLQTVLTVLTELEAADKPMVTALNKMDKVSELPPLPELGSTIPISALHRTNLGRLASAIAEGLSDRPVRTRFVIPFTRGDLLGLLHAKGDVLSTNHTEAGTEVVVDVLQRYANKVEAELSKA
ncbi:MAG: GTPase HflX [Firmicutes bacterium]|nr:GTPase HflX [candidate division NPL-UPA2 bacterium]MBT9153509.1 GTPase HflX [candidate division NPL-UPA2 bacterium]MBT9156011.1 GTPase HflX [candidate division NPL-UPA2 bacterium]